MMLGLVRKGCYGKKVVPVCQDAVNFINMLDSIIIPVVEGYIILEECIRASIEV